LYYKEVQLKERGFYKNDVKIDIFEQYYENGQLKEKGNFKDGVKMVFGSIIN
jgi:antitoxin component YwqK of YwqJK toxin-antitoxin module